MAGFGNGVFASVIHAGYEANYPAAKLEGYAVLESRLARDVARAEWRMC